MDDNRGRDEWRDAAPQLIRQRVTRHLHGIDVSEALLGRSGIPEGVAQGGGLFAEGGAFGRGEELLKHEGVEGRGELAAEDGGVGGGVAGLERRGEGGRGLRLRCEVKGQF